MLSPQPVLSRTAEYALRAVIVIARHHGKRSVGSEEIATILGAPKNYLSKTLNVLVRGGIVCSTRGPGGGFTLAIEPDVLSVARIAGVFAEPAPIGVRCLLSEANCNPTKPCYAHTRWTQIQENAEAPLRTAVISDLCERKAPRPRGTAGRR